MSRFFPKGQNRDSVSRMKESVASCCRRWRLLAGATCAMAGPMACGSARPDDECVHFVNPELASAPPSVVRVAFQLRQCDGERPVAAMDLADFAIEEDGAGISSFESGAAVVRDDRSFQQAVVLMLDVSGSVLGSLPELKTAAKSLVEGLSRQPRVALYTFDGRAEAVLRADFTTDLSLVSSAIDAIPAEAIDTSTNLNGAIVQGVRRLEERRLAVEGTGVLYAGALALFTDGTDRAARVPQSAALEAVGDSSVSVFAIGLGSEIDEKYLRSIGKSGDIALADDLAGLSDAFAEVGQSISALANSYYVLAYCSPSRASSHELSLSLPGYSGEWKGSFDATGFAGGCTPENFLLPAP
jgi:uncharacterized protein YegL